MHEGRDLLVSARLRLILDAYLVGVCDGALGADCARSPEEMAQIRTRLLSAMRMAMRKERNHLHAEGARLDALAEALDETGS